MMEQIKKYIRGNKERGHDVIAELEKLGGKNILKLKGDEYDKVYYIERYKYTNANTIDFVTEKSFIGQLIVTHPDWEEIELPKKFKDGDVVYINTNLRWIAIYKELEKSRNQIGKYASIRLLSRFDSKYISDNRPLCNNDDVNEIRLATEEEKEKLFKAIKDNGYKWNPQEKTLEKLIIPKFKVGDVIRDKDGYKVTITEVNVEDECYEYESMIAKGIGGIAFTEQNDWELVPVVQKFKVGDRVRNKNYKDYIYDIYDITDKGYRAKEIDADFPIIILFGSQEDNYELVPNKFDITTLKPFDKVLVKTNVHNPVWTIDFYGGYDSKIGGSFKPFAVTGGKYFQQCIPYEGNEHLLGTSNDCSEFYKTWK